MKPYKILHQDDAHYLIHDGEGQPFKVAKAALSPEIHAKIQKFADGGEVQPANTDPSTGAPLDSQTADPLGPLRFAIGNDPPAAPSAAPVADPAPVASEPAPTPQPVAKPPPIAAEKPMKIPGAPAEIGLGAQQEQRGIAQEADAKQAGLAEQAKIEAAKAARLQQVMDQGAQMAQQRQAGADTLFQDVQTAKIDPGHFWNTRTTGQKISATIGMILGGIGAGINGGPNFAAQTINNAIDHDIESQKVDLGKRESLLGRYLEQTKDLQAAQRLAKADVLDVTAAQLAASTAKTGGQMAAGEAQRMIGALRQHAAVERQEGTLREYQIKGAAQSQQMAQEQMEAMRQLLHGISGGGGFNRQILELPAFKDYRERAVDLPDGSVAFAPDKEEAGKARESMASVGTLKAKVQRYAQLLHNGNPATTDRGEAQALHADILAEMGHLHGLARLSDKELELFQQQVPDLSDAVKPLAAQKLKALGQAIDDKAWSVNSALLHRPNARRPGGA